MRTLAFIIAATTLFAATPSHAGSQWTFASCYHFSDGSGSCSGTFQSFRNSSDPNAYAEFGTSIYNGWFNGSINGTYGYCILPSSNPLFSSWWQWANARGSFVINWNAAGVCTGGYVVNGSGYGNY